MWCLISFCMYASLLTCISGGIKVSSYRFSALLQMILGIILTLLNAFITYNLIYIQVAPGYLPHLKKEDSIFFISTSITYYIIFLQIVVFVFQFSNNRLSHIAQDIKLCYNNKFIYFINNK